MKIQKKILSAVVACLLAPGAYAATISITPASATGTPGAGTDPTPIGISFTGDGVTVGFEVEVAYDTASLNATAAGANGGSCAAADATGIITLQYVDGSLSPIGGPTVFCNITFTVDAGVATPAPGDPDVVFPLTLQNALFSDADLNAAPGPHTLNDGQILIQGTPPDANLVYTPASGGTVTFPGGTSGTSTVESIDVTATGTSGSGTVESCTLGGANPGAFVVNTTFPLAVAIGAAETIDLTCNLGNAAATATLSCTESDASSTAQSFNLSCPAGTPVPAPEFDSTPAPGATIACNGAPGSVTTGAISITNAGFAGVGSDLTYTCSTGSAGFAVTSGAAGSVVVGGSASVGFSCTVPADGTTTATGTITCTSNDADEATVTYGLSAGPLTEPTPIAAPAVIPANSLWSKLALFGLLAGLGGLVISMRRH